jgi:nucleotide-binding universal stress UspA family protein
MNFVENPFKKIAIAVAFSPRCEALLAEARQLQDKLGAQMVFIHIGKKTLHQEHYLKHLIHRFGLDLPNNKIIWEEGETVDTILEVCQQESIDLLVAGALEKENLLKYFLGGVARNLSRKVKCSMLMLTEPNIHPTGFKHLVVEGSDHPKSEYTIATAIAFGKAYQVKNIDIVQENGLCVSNGSLKNNGNNECNNILPYLKNLREIEFLGTTFTVPGDDYLEYLYSSSWKTPKKSKFNE